MYFAGFSPSSPPSLPNHCDHKYSNILKNLIPPRMEVPLRYKLLGLCFNCLQYLDCLHCLHHCIYCSYFSNCFLHCWIPLSIRIPHIKPVGPKLNFSSHGNRCLVVRPPRQASIRLMQILLWAPELPPYLLVWLGRLHHIGRGPTSPCWTWNIFGTWVGHQKILAYIVPFKRASASLRGVDSFTSTTLIHLL